MVMAITVIGIGILSTLPVSAATTTVSDPEEEAMYSTTPMTDDGTDGMVYDSQLHQWIDPEEQNYLDDEQPVNTTPDVPVEKPKVVRRNGYPKGDYKVPHFIRGNWVAYGRNVNRAAGYGITTKRWWSMVNDTSQLKNGVWYMDPNNVNVSSDYKVYRKPHKNKWGWWVMASVIYYKQDPYSTDPFWAYDKTRDRTTLYFKYVSKNRIKVTNYSHPKGAEAQSYVYKLRRVTKK